MIMPCKWFLPHIFILFLLSGCVSAASRQITQPIQILTITPITPITSIAPTNTSSLAPWCTTFIQVDNLPAAIGLRDSHIIYSALARTDDNQVMDQIWTISLEDGSEELTPDAFPMPFTDSGQYIDSAQYHYSQSGYSLSSSDGRHIAILEHWSEASNPNATPSLFIRDVVRGQDNEVFRGSRGDEMFGGWSPSGNLFVFTYYSNIPEYFSLVYAVNSDGTNLRPLTERMNSVTFDRPRWSPNGMKIAIPVFGIAGDTSIMMIDFPSGDVRLFRTSPIINTYSTQYGNWVEQGEMTWSPDSHWFAYLSGYGHYGIEILDSLSGEIFCIESHPDVFVNRVIWRYDSP